MDLDVLLISFGVANLLSIILSAIHKENLNSFVVRIVATNSLCAILLGISSAVGFL